MFREFSELAKIIAQNTACRVFSAGIADRYIYPYRLVNVESASPRVRDACYELIMDSRYEDESVSNEDVIEAAQKYNVDYVIPKDYPGDRYRTHASVMQFMEEYATQDMRRTAFVVLQPPHASQYDEYAKVYEQYSHFALGGLQDLPTAEQIQAVRNVRDRVGQHKYLHLLGVGTSPEMVRFLREEQLVDSIDVSTAENAIKNCKIPDRTWEQTGFKPPCGEDSSTIRAVYSKAILYQLNYMLSPLCDDGQIPVDEDIIKAASKQVSLEDICALADAANQ